MNNIPSPFTVEDVLKKFQRRRHGFIKALTADVEQFFEVCDPEIEHLCLYGLPDGTWKVALPINDLEKLCFYRASGLHEPTLGIKLPRDDMRDMRDEEWLSLVAVHCDACLLSIAFYFSARFGFDKRDIMRLFGMINDLPTVNEVVRGNVKSSKNQSGNYNSSTTNSSRPVINDIHMHKTAVAKEEGGSGEGSAILCRACGESYGNAYHEFWISCDFCERWFHGKCLMITAAVAEHLEIYKYPSYNNN